MFVVQCCIEIEIVVVFNDEGIFIDFGWLWMCGIVYQVLINEKYIGNNVYNWVFFKLKVKWVVNMFDMWVWGDGVFEVIVECDFFEVVQWII